VKKLFEKLFNKYVDRAAAITVEVLEVTITLSSHVNDYLNFDRLSDNFYARKRKKLTAALSNEYDRYTKRFDPRDKKITNPL